MPVIQNRIGVTHFYALAEVTSSFPCAKLESLKESDMENFILMIWTSSSTWKSIILAVFNALDT